MNRITRIVRHIMGFLLGLVLILIIALFWNYLAFTSKQLQVAPAPMIAWDRASLFKHLQGAIQIPTISQPLAKIAEHSPLHRFRGYLEETFPRLHRTPFIRRTGLDFGDASIPSLLFEWPGKNPDLPGILLMSHFDVVPIEDGTCSKWTHPPFSGHIDGTFLWGRGTLDCKHGVMAILEAVDRLASDGFQPDRPIYLAFGHDEELGGRDGNAKMAEWLRAQGRKLHVVLDEGGCVFTEFPGLNQPAALIGVAEKGMLNVELSVEVPSTESGHASMPPPETAVNILAQAINRVHAAPFPSRIDNGLRDTFRFLGPEMPSLARRIALANLWLTESFVTRELAKKPSSNALLRTTVAATMLRGGDQVNVLPQRAEASFNLRLIPGDSIEGALQHIQRSVDDPRVTISSMPPGQEASRFSSIESSSYENLHRTIRAIYPDVVVAPFVLVGSTDSVHYSDLSENIYRFIPARLAEKDTQRFHGIDERLALNDYVDIVRFYHHFLLNYK